MKEPNTQAVLGGIVKTNGELYISKCESFEVQFNQQIVCVSAERIYYNNVLEPRVFIEILIVFQDLPARLFWY